MGEGITLQTPLTAVDISMASVAEFSSNLSFGQQQKRAFPIRVLFQGTLGNFARPPWWLGDALSDMISPLR